MARLIIDAGQYSRLTLSGGAKFHLGGVQCRVDCCQQGERPESGPGRRVQLAGWVPRDALRRRAGEQLSRPLRGHLELGSLIAVGPLALRIPVDELATNHRAHDACLSNLHRVAAEDITIQRD